jgi:hypothetical protein
VRERDDGCRPFGADIHASEPCELMPRYSPCLRVSLFRGNHRTSGLPHADQFALAGGGDFAEHFDTGVRAFLLRFKGLRAVSRLRDRHSRDICF